MDKVEIIYDTDILSKKQAPVSTISTAPVLTKQQAPVKTPAVIPTKEDLPILDQGLKKIEAENSEELPPIRKKNRTKTRRARTRARTY